MRGYLIDKRILGKKFKALRVNANLTQEELADALGYSMRNIRRYENEGTSSLDVVNIYASYFSKSAMDILDGCSLFLFPILFNI